MVQVKWCNKEIPEMSDLGDEGLSNAMGSLALPLQCDSLEKTQSTARPHCVRCSTNISIALKSLQSKYAEGGGRREAKAWKSAVICL